MHRSRNKRRGFSLPEALVSMTILVIVMVIAMSLLFSMRSFASRQQFFTEPRQSSRRAIDYLAYHVEGAADLNAKRNNPLALVTWYLNSKTGLRQATYNSLSGLETGNGPIGAGGRYTKFGDVGTDILSVAVPVNPMAIPVAKWVGGLHAANLKFDFREGCPNDAYNMQLFQQLTGATGSGNQQQSGVLVLADANGNYANYEITSYQQSTCPPAGTPFDASNPTPVIHVVSNPGNSGFINPPGGEPTWSFPVTLSAGIQFMTFRVRTPTDPAGKPTGPPSLEQRIGLFDPTTDNPGTAFAPIVENIEDLQVAYLYASSPGGGNLIFGTETTAIPASVGALATKGVPTQAGSVDPPTPYDVTNVIGLRITTVGRSGELPLVAIGQKPKTGTGATHYRPQAEDHAQGANDVPTNTAGGFGLFDHYRTTTTLMLRNRMLGK
ncbi:MAG: type II secretion system protein [Thermoanaerobaculia bacterium]